MRRTKDIDVCGQRLRLLPERAVLWRRERMLIIADPHFGKAQVFRDSGIPVPPGTTAADIDRLSQLLERHRPEELLVLGDLMHGRIDRPQNFVQAVAAWRLRWRRTRISLVTGNHDRRAGRSASAFGLDRIVDRLIIDPFVFNHKPDRKIRPYVIAGHCHPAVTVIGKARQKDTLPCFCFGNHRALLPAFGSFTGNHPIHPGLRERVFVIAEEEVIEMAPDRRETA